MRIVKAKKGKIINLGYQGENNVLTVQFDVTGWAELYGEGTFSLMNLRPTETIGYECEIESDENFVYWVVTDVDVGIAGNGRVQLTYTVDEAVAKSVQFFTLIQSSIGIGETPDPAPTWLQELLDEVSELQGDVSDIQEELQIATNAEIDAALYEEIDAALDVEG